ncbi:unnamed protein product [Urochloa decumbens]|uniref:Nucleotide-diphospho-sugar transferase domain-containing protein n=1 Tax=Urochloa decumbens TaxID=240449 RepID=A0ABC9G735_9POAL
MSTVTNLLRFLLVASIGTVGYVVLLQQRYSPFPCSHVDAVPQATTSRNNKATRSTDNPATDAASAAAAAGDDNLPELLSRAAMEDNTIIMTFTNKAWSAPGSLTDLFLESFRTGIRTAPLLNHLVIVAVDAAAFSRCQQTHPLCYALPVTTNNQSASTTAANYASEQRYMAGDYLEMMWRRNRFQARVLDLGYNFVFTDVDIVWLRNPLLRIPVGGRHGLLLRLVPRQQPLRPRQARQRRVPVREGEREDGRVLRGVERVEGGVPGAARARKDWHKLCTFHANCVIGLEGKLEMLRGVLDEWQRFKAKAGPNGTVLTD